MRARTLGERIEQLRKLSDMSSRELDALASLGIGHSRMIETEPRDGTAAKTVAAVAAVFGVSIDWLYLGIGEKPSADDVSVAVARARGIRARKGAA